MARRPPCGAGGATWTRLRPPGFVMPWRSRTSKSSWDGPSHRDGCCPGVGGRGVESTGRSGRLSGSSLSCRRLLRGRLGRMLLLRGRGSRLWRCCAFSLVQPPFDSIDHSTLSLGRVAVRDLTAQATATKRRRRGGGRAGTAAIRPRCQLPPRVPQALNAHWQGSRGQAMPWPSLNTASATRPSLVRPTSVGANGSTKSRTNSAAPVPASSADRVRVIALEELHALENSSPRHTDTRRSSPTSSTARPPLPNVNAGSDS